MDGNLGLIKLMAVFALVIGWGIFQLVSLRLDRNKKQAESESDRADRM